VALFFIQTPLRLPMLPGGKPLGQISFPSCTSIRYILGDVS
jgi:hypothetical protein